MVENDPVVLPDLDGVYINLKIYKELQIPSASRFTIGSSGLLGIVSCKSFSTKTRGHRRHSEPGAVVQGKSESGINDVTEQAEALLSNIQEAVGNINKVAQKLNTDFSRKQPSQTSISPFPI